MGVLLKEKVEIRENRLHTILTYNGDAKSLEEASKDNKLKIGRFKFSQCGNCQEGCAFMQVYSVHDAAIVSHSPIGCFANVSERWNGMVNVAKLRGKDSFTHHAICTNIQEADTIYGKIGVKVWIYKGEILQAKKVENGGKKDVNSKKN